ncbi:hypothetical protein CEXT_740431 [Caerostris extrusa]|uniref:Uncharacterized protein n=1 Tax=Caerostris extrusa TaxID=172846 RepID=A0AAV4YCR6_CAEEX|nr:hypothetical protein CEXT_740431 [Caerostris extrusa]
MRNRQKPCRSETAWHFEWDVTVISHVPRYGMWELFSYIGGLIGCWLGISVWAFVDIIEGNCRRLLRLIQKLKQKSKNKLQVVFDLAN